MSEHTPHRTEHIANTRYREPGTPEARPDPLAALFPADGRAARGSGPLAATDALVLAVRDARRAAHEYRTALGMQCTAYAGPETGHPHLHSYVLESGGTRYVLSSAAQPGGSLARHLADHGEGVVEVGLRVADAYYAYDYAVDRGALPVAEPYELSDRHGTVVLAVIGTAGPVRHTLVDRSRYTGPYLPGYVSPSTVEW